MQLHIDGGIKSKVKNFTKILNQQLKTVVLGWQRKILPGHFRRGAARKYKYETRSIRYQRRKQKKGMLPALVFTGRARDKLTRPAFFRVVVSKGKAVGKFIVGSDISYFYMRRPGQPNMAKETTATTKAEQEAMRDFLLETIPEEMDKVKGKQVIR